MFNFLFKKNRGYFGLGPKLTYREFIFRGWADDASRLAASGSIDVLDDEIRAKRRSPAHPDGIVEITASGEKETSTGTTITVLADQKKVADTQIISYLMTLGIQADAK